VHTSYQSPSQWYLRAFKADLHEEIEALEEIAEVVARLPIGRQYD